MPQAFLDLPRYPCAPRSPNDLGEHYKERKRQESDLILGQTPSRAPRQNTTPARSPARFRCSGSRRRPWPRRSKAPIYRPLPIPTSSYENTKRMGEDSNPRWTFAHCGFQDRSRTPENIEETRLSASTGANAVAVETKREQFAPDLQAIIDAWPTLPDAIKVGIVAMIRAAGQP
jgi:hypothetical protein